MGWVERRFANEIANEPCDTRWYSTTRNGRGSTQILDCQALMITAQHDGRPTFNPQVVGSIPTEPTKLVCWRRKFLIDKALPRSFLCQRAGDVSLIAPHIHALGQS